MARPWKSYLTYGERLEWKHWLKRGTKKKKSKADKRRTKQHPYDEEKEAAIRCRNYLVGFWKEFSLVTTTEQRLELMKKAARPGWARVSDGLHSRLRAKFLKKRYPQALYDIECLVCGSEHARERHHIVPLCYGGTNEIENLLRIGYSCHDAIHPWMVSSV